MALPKSLNFYTFEELSTYTLETINGTLLFSVMVTVTGSRDMIGKTSPYNVCNVKFITTSDIDKWECRATLVGQPYGVGVGLLLNSGNSIEVTNILKNNALANNWTALNTYINTDKKFINEPSVRLVGNTGFGEMSYVANVLPFLNNTHLYYSRIYVFINSGLADIGFYWPIAEPSLTDHRITTATNQWVPLGAVNDRKTFSNGNHTLRFDFNNLYTAQEIYVGGFMLMDLTADFGTGKEPSKEWLDKNVDFFIDKSVVLPVKENTEISFDVNNTQLTLGDGQYRISVYVQKDNIWYGG